MQAQGIDSLTDLADARFALSIQGRYGDTMIGHLTPGEMVLPRPIADDPVLKRQLFEAFDRHELNPHQFQVGHFDNSINPMTGAPEFGFFKELGKLVKKAAPVIGSVVGFALGGPPGAAIGGGIGGGVKHGSIEGVARGAAMGYIGGNIAVGAGVTPNAGITSLNPFGANSMFANLGATPTAAGAEAGIGGLFQNLGAKGASMLGMGSVAGTPAANILGKGGYLSGLSGLQKAGAVGLGLTALGGFAPGENDAQMPGPSGELGGYLQRPLTPATLPTQYGTEGVQLAGSGIGGLPGAMPQSFAGVDPTTQFLASALIDQDYNQLAYPTFERVGVKYGGELDLRKTGGDISDPEGAGDVDTVDAKLADGEFVITKQAVKGIGDGDHSKGIQRLYDAMAMNEMKAQKMGMGRA